MFPQVLSPRLQAFLSDADLSEWGAEELPPEVLSGQVGFLGK